MKHIVLFREDIRCFFLTIYKLPKKEQEPRQYGSKNAGPQKTKHTGDRNYMQRPIWSQCPAPQPAVRAAL